MLFLQKTSVKHSNVILFSYSHIQSLLFVVWSLVLAEGQQEGKKFEFSCRISFDYIVLKHVNSVHFFSYFFSEEDPFTFGKSGKLFSVVYWPDSQSRASFYRSLDCCLFYLYRLLQTSGWWSYPGGSSVSHWHNYSSK